MKFKSSIALLAALVASLLGVSSASATSSASLWVATGTGSNPDTLTTDAAGNVYVNMSVSGAAKIGKITPSGTLDSGWATPSGGRTTIGIDGSGTVYAGADTGATRTIEAFTTSGGSPATTYTLGYDGPSANGMTVTSGGDVWWVIPTSAKKVGKIPFGTAAGNPPAPAVISDQPCAVAIDAAGNAYVGTRQSHVYKYTGAGFSSSSTPTATYNVSGGGNLNDCVMRADANYVYFAGANPMNQTGFVDRISVSSGAVEASWGTLATGATPRALAVGTDGKIYVASRVNGMGGGSGNISTIASSGTVTVLATPSFAPNDMALDASTNVYLTNLGSGMGQTAGVYKITQASPTPSSTTSSTTSAATSSSAPAPGPALKVSSIPAQITVTIAPTPSGDTQEISTDVPCTAPEGQTLERCSVKMTAPEAVLLGQGDGIQVRSDKKVTIGQATVKSKSGKKVIVVKVKINPKGRKALKINTKITATIGLTAVTVSNLKSTGSTTSEMRLPTQLLSPEAGIFSSNSIELNKAGIAFVSRLAALLPKKPKAITCIGFADNTGVPGDNRWLGDRRAKAVCNALEAKGIDAVKTSIETKAATSPRADNSTATGRERNRRVSIRITY